MTWITKVCCCSQNPYHEMRKVSLVCGLVHDKMYTRHIHTKTVPLSRNMRMAEHYFSRRGQTYFLLFPSLSNCLDQTQAIKWNQLWTQQWDIFCANTSFRSSIRYLLFYTAHQVNIGPPSVSKYYIDCSFGLPFTSLPSGAFLFKMVFRVAPSLV